jgi:hypothetical protein
MAGSRRLAALALAAALSACGSTPPAPPPTGSTARPAGPVAPVSRDVPIPLGTSIHAPSEPPETPLGELAYVVDSRALSVYEFDLGRGRFLGPAPRVVAQDDRTLTLPGYPFVVSSHPPQQAAVAPSWLFVAGGIDGTVVIMRRTPGLGAPRAVALPAVPVQREARSGGGSVSNASQTGAPFIIRVVALGDSQAVAISQDDSGTSVAYLVDAADGRVLRSVQLPGGTATAAAALTGGGQLAVGMNEGHVLVLDGQLRVVADRPLEGNPRGMAVAGGDVAISTTAAAGHAPASDLWLLDPRTGAIRHLSGAGNPYSGSVAAAGGTVWWALSDLAQVRELRTDGTMARTLGACKYISSVAAGPAVLLATCLEHSQLAVVDLSSGGRRLYDAGSWPASVALPSI